MTPHDTSPRACSGWRPAGLGPVVVLLLLPAPAGAQKDPFIDAFIEFHSEIQGTYGDEGSRAAAALDKMEGALKAWNAENQKAEASLRAAPGFAPSTLALFFLEAGRFSEALTAIESALRLEPPRPGLHLFRGVLLEALGRGAEAVPSFAAAWRLDPDDPLSAYLLADRTAGQAPELERQIASVFAASRRPGAVWPRFPFIQVALIDDRAAETPRFAPANLAGAFAVFAQGRYEEAIAGFRAVLAQDPLVADPVGRSDGVRRGVAALRAKRAAEAIADFEDAVQQYPASSEARRVLGVAHAATGNIVASIEHLTAAISLSNTDERARVALGRVLLDAGRTDDAERALLETVELLPASGRARWALADLYVQAGRGIDAIAQLEAAALLPVPAGKSALLWRLANLTYQLHDRERFVSALARRIRLIPNDAAAHRNLGLAYHQGGRDDEALLELLIASLFGLGDAEMLTVMGQIHLNAGRTEAAETVLRRAVTLDTSSAEARYALGRALLQLGRTSEGQQELAAFKKLRLAQIDAQRRQTELEVEQRTKDPAAGAPKE